MNEDKQVCGTHLPEVQGKSSARSIDEETGLHYNRFRYYDNDVGMFISRDPIGLMGGHNVFAYAPNPTGWIDPLGLFRFGTRPLCSGTIKLHIK